MGSWGDTWRPTACMTNETAYPTQVTLLAMSRATGKKSSMNTSAVPMSLSGRLTADSLAWPNGMLAGSHDSKAVSGLKCALRYAAFKSNFPMSIGVIGNLVRIPTIKWMRRLKALLSRSGTLVMCHVHDTRSFQKKYRVFLRTTWYLTFSLKWQQ